MQHNIAEINDYPTVMGKSLLFCFLFILFADFVYGGVCQGIKHTVAGAGANNKVVGKGRNIFDVHQYDIFAFFIFEGVDNIAGKV